ncbi:MAG: tRNA guanosine(34) transglycosylase Tgt [Opitutae bacterium]|jgi:queuine tRNA-ribosyltransferase|nr:tRNA guanosine(34) transglycosylase Tgt [Opitutae bacterium]MBT5715868.1 tRNA guanosine(34) transglycosylase Tgt [Opitutae bacterium]
MNSLNSIKPESLNHARTGKVILPAGEVFTPVFMPVGTQATVKGILPRDLNEVVKASIILGNTYHLNLRPGVEVIREAGGLARFMNWDGPILTDSGGFQVFSLAKLRKLNDDGVLFHSHIDGREVFLGPREAIDIQDALKSDIAMCLDECPPAEASKSEIGKAVDRSTNWAKSCLDAWNETNAIKDGRKLFGIVQGGRFPDLRRRSAEELQEIGFPGYAIGGVSVGESEEEMLEQVSSTVQFLPADLPRYVMGVGTPTQLLKMVGYGIDMFDCVLPSRAARHGTAYTSTGKINIRNEKFRLDLEPLDKEADCFASKEFSRSYLRHLFMAKESLGGVLLTLHNLRFFVKLMEEARVQINAGSYSEWASDWIERYNRGICQ